MTTAPVLDLSSAPNVPACDHKDRFVERQLRTTAQSIRLIMVDLVKYYVVFPVLATFEEEEWDGRVKMDYFEDDGED
ncbi:hypothetical protein EJB05_29013 [Eragrostis curvula]|uniref:Uncharacterized protein n=1 Tax=Eragrostis curvula TaxID=38414 RepID=A0A5J9USG0_9POAL|nr:hypothetical protein EJB05_29013 [Eragrostis curvula]